MDRTSHTIGGGRVRPDDGCRPAPPRRGARTKNGLLVVEPVFHERVWGGTTLRQWYGDDVPAGTIGEAWVVCGLPGQAGVVSSGTPPGWTLDRAWAAGLVTG